MSNKSSTRRQFVKQSAGLMTGAALATSLSIARRSYAADDSTIKVGLVGCGGRGTGAASQALATSGPTKLVAVADAFANQADNAVKLLKVDHPEKVDEAKVLKFIGFDAYKQLMEADVDLVVLATSPHFRPIHFAHAVEKGKHVFMEKPVAVDMPGTKMVLEAAENAKAKGLKVGVGLQRHHDPRYVETVKRIHDGEIGEVLFTRCYWNQGAHVVQTRADLQRADPNLTEMAYQMRNWYYFTWLSGDHIVEQHIHNIDVCNWVMKAYPDLAQGQGGRQVRTGKDYGMIFDHHAVEFCFGPRWDTGARMLSQCRQIEKCWNATGEFAHGTKGVALIGGFRFLDHEGKTIWRIDRAREAINPYQIEHDDLFAAIRNNTEFNEAINGALSTQTGIMGRMATYSGDIIKLSTAVESGKALKPQRYAFDADPPVMPDKDGNYPVPMPGQTESLA